MSNGAANAGGTPGVGVHGPESPIQAFGNGGLLLPIRDTAPTGPREESSRAEVLHSKPTKSAFGESGTRAFGSSAGSVCVAGVEKKTLRIETACCENQPRSRYPSTFDFGGRDIAPNNSGLPVRSTKPRTKGEAQHRGAGPAECKSEVKSGLRCVRSQPTKTSLRKVEVDCSIPAALITFSAFRGLFPKQLQVWILDIGQFAAANAAANALFLGVSQDRSRAKHFSHSIEVWVHLLAVDFIRIGVEKRRRGLL